MKGITYLDRRIVIPQKGKSQKKMYWLLFAAFNAITIGLALAEADWLYLLIIVVPFFVYCSIRNPFILPFGLYVFLVPFDRVLAIMGLAGGATLTKLVGALTILVLSLKGSFEKKITRPGAASLALILLVAYCLLTCVWAIKPNFVFLNERTIVSLLIFYLIAAAYRIQENEFNILKWCILLGGGLAAALTFYSYRSGLLYGHTLRATIAFNADTINPNFLSLSLLIPLSICIQMMLTSRSKMHKILFLCVFLFVSYVVILTGSRKSLLALLIILAFYSSHIRNKLSFGIVAFAGIIVLLSMAPDYLVMRLNLADRGAGRLDIWQVGIEALRRYWLLGAGLGNFPLAYNEFINEVAGFQGFGRSSHNIYLRFLIETGIIGLSLLFWTFKKHYELIKKSSLARYDLNVVMLKASFWSMLVSGFFADITLDKSFWLLLIMIAMYRNMLQTEYKHSYLEKGSHYNRTHVRYY
jgi:O-antigen ligase